MTLKSWAVYLPKTSKIGVREDYTSLEDDTLFVMIGNEAEEAAQGFRDALGPMAGTSMLTEGSASDIATYFANVGTYASADSMLRLVKTIERNIGSIHLFNALAVFKGEAELKSLRLVVSEAGKTRVVNFDLEVENDEIDALDVAAEIQAMF